MQCSAVYAPAANVAQVMIYGTSHTLQYLLGHDLFYLVLKSDVYEIKCIPLVS